MKALLEGLWATSVPVEEAEDNDSGWSSDTHPGKSEYSGCQYTWYKYVDWANLVSNEVG